MSDVNGINGTFVRRSSGLVREFNLFDVFVFNVLGYALGLTLAIAPGLLGATQPNANVYMVLTLGVVLSVCNGMTYGLFAALMPRSGGDYIFIGRTFHPWLGFTASWGFTWSQLLGLGAYAGLCVSEALSPALSAIGAALGNKQLSAFGASLNSPLAVFMFGTALLAVVLAISLLGMRVIKWMLNTLFFIAMLGIVVMYGVFATCSHDEFVERFNAAMLSSADVPNAYGAILAMADEYGKAPNELSTVFASLMALPIGYWVFIGFTYSAYVGGEVREPARTQPRGILAALLFGYLFYMLILGEYFSVVSNEFNSAIAVVQTLPDNPLPAAGTIGYFVSVLSESVLVNTLVSVSTLLWFFLLLFILAQICVRSIFAWAFDGLFPTWLTHVSARTGAPWAACVLIFAVAEAILAVSAFSGYSLIDHIIMLFSVCFLITGVAGVVFPFRRKDIFNRGPSIAQRRLAGLPMLSIVGAGNVVLFTIVLLSSIVSPSITSPGSMMAAIVLCSVYGSGALVYKIAVRRAHRIVSFEELYEEIPPE